MLEGPTNNPIGLRNLYPAAGGASTAQAGLPLSPSTTNDTSDAIPMVSKLEEGFQYSLLGNPVKWWIAIVVILFGGMWLATRFKGSAASANIRFNFYNILAILFLSIAGGSIAKVLAAKYQRYLPGVATVILAS